MLSRVTGPAMPTSKTRGNEDAPYTAARAASRGSMRDLNCDRGTGESRGRHRCRYPVPPLGRPAVCGYPVPLRGLGCHDRSLYSFACLLSLLVQALNMVVDALGDLLERHALLGEIDDSLLHAGLFLFLLSVTDAVV